MSFMSYPNSAKECSVGSYLEIAEKAQQAPLSKKEAEAGRPSGATSDETVYDINDINDQSPPNFTPLTVSEALAGINASGTGAAKNAELYRQGELTEERAVEYVTCAILQRRGESFEPWRHHAPAVRKALSLCIHQLRPEECKVCNGYARKLIEEGGAP
jgi:hypothetical protein